VLDDTENTTFYGSLVCLEQLKLEVLLVIQKIPGMNNTFSRMGELTRLHAFSVVLGSQDTPPHPSREE